MTRLIAQLGHEKESLSIQLLRADGAEAELKLAAEKIIQLQSQEIVMGEKSSELQEALLTARDELSRLDMYQPPICCSLYEGI